MIIREVQNCDWKGLTKLLSESFGTRTIYDYDKFDEWIMRPNQHIFVGIVDDRIVATYTAVIEYKLIHNYGTVAHLEDLAVDKRYNGRGLAKKMMEYMVEWLKRKGVYKAIMTTRRELVPLHNNVLGTYEHEVCLRRDFT